MSSATLTLLSASLVLYSQTTTALLHPDLCSFSALGHPWSFSLMYATTRNRTIFSTVKNLSRTSLFWQWKPQHQKQNKKDNHNKFSFLFSAFTDSHLLVLTVVEWDDARCGYMTDSHLLVLTVVEWDNARCGYMINWWGGKTQTCSCVQSWKMYAFSKSNSTIYWSTATVHGGFYDDVYTLPCECP